MVCEKMFWVLNVYNTFLAIWRGIIMIDRWIWWGYHIFAIFKPCQMLLGESVTSWQWSFLFSHQFLVEGCWTPLQGLNDDLPSHFLNVFKAMLLFSGHPQDEIQSDHHLKYAYNVVPSRDQLVSFRPASLSPPLSGKGAPMYRRVFSVAALGLQSHLIIRASSKTWFWMGSVSQLVKRHSHNGL
jgi:hypothetical protein